MAAARPPYIVAWDAAQINIYSSSVKFSLHVLENDILN
jgi:hypothetical protein